MLAIDLSRASLAYAARKTRALGLRTSNTRRPTSCGSERSSARFDLIESAGVLHHLADPCAGWRVLLSLLRPGGFMRDRALQRDRARASVVAARALHRGARAMARPPTTSGASGRTDARADDATARNICRVQRLLQHERMPRSPVPRAGAPHDAPGRSSSFSPSRVCTSSAWRSIARRRGRYATRFPADPAMTDLDQLACVRAGQSAHVRDMYRFWVQTPAD